MTNGPGLSRRDFLHASGAAGIVAMLASSGLLGACTQQQLQDFLNRIHNRPVRKDIATLSPTDPVIQSFKRAVQAMKALDPSDRRNWTNQATIHNDFCPHHNWLLLPWHRAYLWYFEEICRELSGDNNFALPYWNWTANPTIPAVFFDPASSLYDANRDKGPSDTISAGYVGTSVINGILGETNFLNFASGPIDVNADQRTSNYQSPLEATPHNNVHTFIGGDMGTFMSPLDAVFWTHHGRVDELWVEWNIIRGNANSSDGAWASRHFTEFCDRHGNPVDVTVFATVLMPFFNYRYDTQTP